MEIPPSAGVLVAGNTNISLPTPFLHGGPRPDSLRKYLATRAFCRRPQFLSLFSFDIFAPYFTTARVVAVGNRSGSDFHPFQVGAHSDCRLLPHVILYQTCLGMTKH